MNAGLIAFCPHVATGDEVCGRITHPGEQIT
ncbi:MAG: hypothetical protein QOJ99_5743, partial [Bryobacterales bacterium]|nr:hypothetical protein [Bryobacterales bacterium]